MKVVAINRSEHDHTRQQFFVALEDWETRNLERFSKYMDKDMAKIISDQIRPVIGMMEHEDITDITSIQ